MSVHRHLALTWLALAATCIAVSPALAANDTALQLSNVSGANTGYVRVANSPAFSLQAFTLEAWVQRVGTGYGFTTDAGGAGILTKPQEGAAGSHICSWHLAYNNSGQINFDLVHVPNASGLYIVTPVSATPLARHHIAATFDGATVLLYVDGVLSASGAWTLGSVYYGAEDVLIGADNFAFGYLRRFDGYIDDVQVWDHARSGAEIARTMNCELTGHEPGLVAYWPFGNSTLVDQSAHGHDGTAVATAGAVAFAPLAPLACTAGVDGPARGGPALAMSVFPQPARDRVTVRFELPEPGAVSVDVMDVAGRKVATWDSRDESAGPHEVTGDLAALRTRAPANAVLFVRVRSGAQSAVRTLVMRR